MPPRKRLGQLLTELGVVDEHQLQSALGHQKQWGGKLGGILVQKGFCSEEDVVSALTRHLGMPRVKLSEQKIDPRATRFVSRAVAEKLHVLAYDVSGAGRSEVVTIAMSDPTDLSAVDQLAFHTGKRIKPMLAGDSEIVRAIAEHYGPDDKGRSPAAPAQAAPAAGAARTETPAPPRPVAAAAPPPRAPAAAANPPREIRPPQGFDLPPAESDGSNPFEPIAAHSQVEEVAGQADFAGGGAAGDIPEGFEPARPGQDPGQESWAAPQGTGWDSGTSWAAPTSPPHVGQAWSSAEAPPPAPGQGWGNAQEPAQGWGEPPAAREGRSEGSAEGASAAPEEVPPAQANALDAPVEELSGAAVEEESAAAQVSAESVHAEPEAGGHEELPADAILGTAEVAYEHHEAEPGWSLEPPAEDSDAPDGWASSDDPLAADAFAEASHEGYGEATPSQDAAPPPPDEAAVAEVPAEAARDAAEASFVEPGGFVDGTEGFGMEGVTPSETPHEEQPPAAGYAAYPAEEVAPVYESEPPAPEAHEAAAAESHEPSPDLGAEAHPFAEEPEPEISEIPVDWSEPPLEEAPAAEAEAAGPEAAEAGAWTEEAHQGAAWGGEAIAEGASLSALDEATLAAAGVDPKEPAAALRLLASLLRVLARRGVVDLADFATEARESTPEELPPRPEHDDA
jgi:hypothetical protein